MSAKLLCATAVMAMGSFMFVDTADAQRRGGAERGDNGRVEAGQRRGRGGARQARGSRNAGQARAGNRTARSDRARPNRSRPNRSRSNRSRPARVDRGSRALPPRALARQKLHGPRAHRRRAGRDPFARGWRKARRWAGRRWAARPTFFDRGCTAVARRNDGNGRVIRGIYGEGFGRRACRKALNRCENQLYYRQAEGRNPYAACVVASR